MSTIKQKHQLRLALLKRSKHFIWSTHAFPKKEKKSHIKSTSHYVCFALKIILLNARQNKNLTNSRIYSIEKWKEHRKNLKSQKAFKIRRWSTIRIFTSHLTFDWVRCTQVWLIVNYAMSTMLTKIGYHVYI